ncbi:hypothetical protein PENTCL1PPCAC_18466, partial [Pristionchus entomophagus]
SEHRWFVLGVDGLSNMNVPGLEESCIDSEDGRLTMGLTQFALRRQAEFSELLERLHIRIFNASLRIHRSQDAASAWLEALEVRVSNSDLRPFVFV